MIEENKIELLEQDDFAVKDEEKKNNDLIKENSEKKDKEKEELIEDEYIRERSESIEVQESQEVKIKASEEEKEEKKSLVGIIERLKEDLDSEEYESLGQIYEQYLNNEDITKRNIKPGTNIKLLFIF